MPKGLGGSKYITLKGNLALNATINGKEIQRTEVHGKWHPRDALSKRQTGQFYRIHGISSINQLQGKKTEIDLKDF